MSVTTHHALGVLDARRQEEDGACVGFSLSTFDVGSGDHDRTNSTAAWIEVRMVASRPWGVYVRWTRGLFVAPARVGGRAASARWRFPRGGCGNSRSVGRRFPLHSRDSFTGMNFVLHISHYNLHSPFSWRCVCCRWHARVEGQTILTLLIFGLIRAGRKCLPPPRG